MLSLKDYTISIKFDVNKTPMAQINNAVNDIAAKANAAGAKVEKSVNNTLNSVNKSAGGALSSLGGYLKGVAGLFAGHEIIKAADEYSKALGRIKLYASDTQQAMDKVFANSQKSGTSFVSQAELVGSVMQNQKHIGLNENQSIQLANTFGKALSMTSQGEAQDSAAILQFVQMMGSEKVTNQDLKPLLHESAAIRKYITDAAGMTGSVLQQMAGKGELSPKQVIGWLMEATDKVNSDFEKMPKTFGQGFQRINNAVIKFVGEWNQSSEASNLFFKLSGFIADNLENIVKSTLLALAAWRMQLFFMRESAEKSKEIAVSEEARAVASKKRLWASTKQLAGIAKMAALLYGVSLIVEDLYYWWTGGLSVSGRFLGDPKDWVKKIDEIKGYFSQFFGWLDKSNSGNFVKKWGTIGILAYTLSKITGAAWALNKVFSLLGGKLTILKTLITLLWGVSRAAAAALAPLLANPITWVILAIAAALALVWYYWDDIKKVTKAAWKATTDTWGEFSTWFGALWDDTINAVYEKWNEFKTSASLLGAVLKSTFKGYVNDIERFFQGLPDRILVWLNQIGAFIGQKAGEWAKMLNPTNWFGGDAPSVTAAKIAGSNASSAASNNNWNPTLNQNVIISGSATPEATGRAVMGATRSGLNSTYPGMPNAEATY